MSDEELALREAYEQKLCDKDYEIFVLKEIIYELSKYDLYTYDLDYDYEENPIDNYQPFDIDYVIDNTRKLIEMGEIDANDETKPTDKQKAIQQIAKMISSGEIPNAIYDKYLSKTKIGFMTYEDLLRYLSKGEKQ